MDVLRSEPDPAGGGSLYDAWAARTPGGAPEPKRIVGATDYTAFMENLGMSCIDMTFEGPYGVYHSMYDNYQWMSRVADPGFHYNTALARVWSVLALRLANAEVLPMRYSRYAKAVPGYLEAVEAKLPADRKMRFDAARAAAGRWEAAATSLEARLAAVPAGSLSADVVRDVNTALLQAERAMTEPKGLRGRPFFKHLLYAPQPTYREELVPRIFEAIEVGRFDELPAYEAELVAAFDRGAATLKAAEAHLGGRP
jgi:N-acetylated-alpha-linked acidic dipeptidase